MSTTDNRAALIARQGSGARYDAAEAPVHNLLLARRGTAYFSRLLNGLRDDALVDDRARDVAKVGYHARGLARLMQWARTGLEEAEHPSTESFNDEVERGTSLPPRALRGLFEHSAIHLDVEWRDLPGPAWDEPVTRLGGDKITARDTPLIRARFIWQSALELDAGGRLADLPLLLRG